MRHSTHRTAATLRSAREAKGLSQRALSQLTGVPQGHISKIEKGGVDLRVSSLVELARALDLELTLVPRKSLPAVNSVIRSTDRPRAHASNEALKELKRLQSHIDAMKGSFPVSTELAQIQRQIRDLKHLNISARYLDDLRQVNKSLKTLKQDAGDLAALQQPLHELQLLRNRIAHSIPGPAAEKVRPAYTLEENNDDE